MNIRDGGKGDVTGDGAGEEGKDEGGEMCSSGGQRKTGRKKGRKPESTNLYL